MDGFVHDQVRDLDALVVGAGFGGIYMLHKLRNELGLDAVAIDKAGGVGGTCIGTSTRAHCRTRRGSFTSTRLTATSTRRRRGRPSS